MLAALNCAVTSTSERFHQHREFESLVLSEWKINGPSSLPEDAKQNLRGRHLNMECYRKEGSSLYLLCLSLIAREGLLGLDVLYIGGVAGWRVRN